MPHLSIATVGATEILVRMRARMLRLEHLEGELDAATEVLYEATRQWFDSEGGGEWASLAESTVQRKASAGYSDPERILYATGQLYESATSASGPYSFRHHPGINDVAIGIDWSVGAVQIPPILAYGSSDGRIPARPIWPTHDSMEYTDMRAKITHLMLRGV